MGLDDEEEGRKPRIPDLQPADMVALLFALAAALVVVLGCIGVIFDRSSSDAVFDTASLMIAGVLGYLSGRATYRGGP